MQDKLKFVQKKKQEIKAIEEILRNNNRFIDIRHANKLHGCCQFYRLRLTAIIIRL